MPERDENKGRPNSELTLLKPFHTVAALASLFYWPSQGAVLYDTQKRTIVPEARRPGEPE